MSLDTKLETSISPMPIFPTYFDCYLLGIWNQKFNFKFVGSWVGGGKIISQETKGVQGT